MLEENPAFNLELLFVLEENSVIVVKKGRHEQTGRTPIGFTPKVRKYVTLHACHIFTIDMLA